MKKNISLIAMLWITAAIFTNCNQDKTGTIHPDDLFYGQTPPGDTTRLFNGGKFFEDENNKKRSFNFAFSSDGEEVFFSYIKRTTERPEPTYEIKSFRFAENEWTEPKTASFSGEYSDFDINFSPDGNYLFFASERPDSNSGRGGIYYLTKNNNGWSEPIYTGSEVNIKYEAWPSFSSKGNLFFQSHRTGGYGDVDLYRAEWDNGKFINVKNLGPNVNSEYGEYNASIAPDESYILLSTSRPVDGNIYQIYISFQIGDNVWTKAKNLGPKINAGGASGPTFSTDGKYLFFRKKTGIHWISTKFIEDFRPKNVN